jgi:uncharacterized damage-inducible protein DinB
MNKQDIALLYKYNQWANAKIAQQVAKVSLEQFLAPANFPHGGLRSTLVHALFAEWIWRHRWEGTSPVVRLKPDDFPTIESLLTRWKDEEMLLMKFVDEVTDQRLNEHFFYINTQGTPYEKNPLAGYGACCEPRNAASD